MSDDFHACHMSEWDIDLFTCEVYRCPDAFKGWKLAGYSLNSARGSGYLDNAMDAELKMEEPTTKALAVVEAAGYYIGGSWLAVTKAHKEREEAHGGYLPFDKAESGAQQSLELTAYMHTDSSERTDD